jgi:CBS domain-containing protein
MNIANLLTTKGRPVITVHPAQTVRGAVALLAEQRVGALVVVDEERRPIGIVTERHIVRSLAADDKVLTRAVGDIMSQDLVTATPQDELALVLHVMAERRIRHIPVVEAGQLAGIVSLGDVIRFQRDQYRGEVDTLETRMMAHEGEQWF